MTLSNIKMALKFAPDIWLDTSGEGYEYIRCKNKSISHHRVLAYAWGLIDTALANGKEIDHWYEIEWLNTEWNLRPLTQGEHSKVTYYRNKARKAGHKQLRLDGEKL